MASVHFIVQWMDQLWGTKWAQH